MTALNDIEPTLGFDPGAEFDRQVQTLLDKGYPTLAGTSADRFERLAAPLRSVAIGAATRSQPPTPARVPFVLVVAPSLVIPENSMPLTALNGRSGFVDRSAADISRFEPIEGLGVPPDQVYLIVDVDRGAATLNVRPTDALATITAQGRTPLTVNEGIALITHFPDSLAKNNCFSLAGSRCGDKRVPALWISAKAPKLGWCWAGNPHTWLGSASCGTRVGASVVRVAAGS